jgi:microcystin-dependent protein
LPNVQLGELAGATSVTLTVGNLPAHNHQLTGTVAQQANNDNAGLNDTPAGARLGAATVFTTAAGDLANMAPLVSTLAIGINGSSQPFGIMPPYTGMNFIICLQGIFPSRN